MNSISQSVNQFMQRSQYIPQQVMSAVQANYNTFVQSQVGRTVNAMRHKLNHYWDPDTITRITTLDGFQQSGDGMSRWLMTDPRLREMRNSQAISGWKDTYVDPTPNAVGVKHRDYRLLNSGQILHPEGKKPLMRRYIEPWGDQVALTTHDKVAIKLSLATINDYLDDGEDDPTSEWNSTINVPDNGVLPKRYVMK